MFRKHVKRDPSGIRGVKRYFRALHDTCTRMKEQPRPPYEEAIVWFRMASNISLPAVRAVCEALQVVDINIFSEEYAALRSELFSWVDEICEYASGADDVTPQRGTSLMLRRQVMKLRMLRMHTS